jgi:hypothetical protein
MFFNIRPALAELVPFPQATMRADVDDLVMLSRNVYEAFRGSFWRAMIDGVTLGL